MGLYLNPGNEEFRNAAIHSKIYVDKTEMIKFTNSQLFGEHKNICVSRPRRFGKSMAANMLVAYYSKGCDSADIFADYEISHAGDFRQHLNKYDVIHLDIQWCLAPAKGAAGVVSYIEKSVIAELKEKYPDKYAGVFAGKDAWVMDEMMLTVLGQQGDYYNQWRYDGADVDSKEYKMAFEGFKKFFDEGIFTKDTLDLDYASATEEFTNGNALVYYMGSWESPLLSKQLREKNGIELEDVGAMALPIVEKDGTASVRSYIDSGIGIVDYSEKKEAAAKFVAYLTLGEGADIFGKQLTGTSAKKEFSVDESLFASDTAKQGWDTVVELINNGTADRNNVSGYSDIEGAEVQSYINGTKTVDEALKTCQKEWTSGKY